MSGTFVSANYDPALGGVMLTVQGMAAGERVGRLMHNGGTAVLHPTDITVSPGSLVDWQPRLGEQNTYVILPTSGSAPGQATASIQVVTLGGSAFLRRLNDPLIMSKVRVSSTGTEGEEVRATTFDISGRRAPLVVFNSRAARRGTITLLTVSRDERETIEYIVADGSPLLFNMCSSKAFQSLQAMVGDVRWTRVGTKAQQFECELDYQEVEDGDWIGADSDFLPPVFHALTYDEIKGLTYQQVFDRYLRYTDVATGTQA